MSYSSSPTLQRQEIGRRHCPGNRLVLDISNSVPMPQRFSPVADIVCLRRPRKSLFAVTSLRKEWLVVGNWN